MQYTLLTVDEIQGRLSGQDGDLQRFASLIGRQNAESSFAGMFVRRHRGDIDEQPWRHHPDEEVEYIVTGRIVVQIGSPEQGPTEQFEAGKGDLFCIPAGVKHRADSVGDELCVGLVFCPKPYGVDEGQPVTLT
jgi:quercetin dioxygenase-like cupin family protein